MLALTSQGTFPSGWRCRNKCFFFTVFPDVILPYDLQRKDSQTVSSHLSAQAPSMLISLATHFLSSLNLQLHASQSTRMVLHPQPEVIEFVTGLSALSSKLSQQVSSATLASRPPTLMSPLEQSSSLLYTQFVTIQLNNGIIKSSFI